MACSISVNERFCLKVCVSTHYVSVLCFLEDQPFLLSKTASIHRPCQGCKEYEGVGTLKSKQVYSKQTGLIQSKLAQSKPWIQSDT